MGAPDLNEVPQGELPSSVRHLDDEGNNQLGFEATALRENQGMPGNFDLNFASQLNRINALSATLTHTTGVRDILATLAENARTIFNGDEAVVILESGPDAPLQAIARRHELAVAERRNDPPLTFPISRGATVAWRELGWLMAPIVGTGDGLQGVVGVRYQSASEVRTADAELLTLLAQIASRTLEGAELRRIIHTSESRLRLLVDVAPVGIVECDGAARVLWWNRRVADLFDWSYCEANDDAAVPIFPKGLRSPLASLWRDVMDTSTTGERDFADVEIRGRTIKLHASATLLPSTHRDDRRIWTLIDGFKEGEPLNPEVRASRQMETRGQLASGVAHDFNNLLTLISGYAEILLQDLGDDDRAFQMVQDIKSTASRASILTGQMQTIGRIKPVAPILLNPIATMRMNAEVLQRIVGVDIEVLWSFDDQPCVIRVDADQFEQMILNLTLNARDAMPLGGQLSISVDAITVEDDRAVPSLARDGDYVLISVADTGLGMDEHTRLRCFEPYFTTKGPLQGSGLGLSAAQRLVEESDGTILCSSQPGVGSTFQIFFPAVKGASTQHAQPTDIVRPHGSAKVLLAEDDNALRRLMGQALVRNGFRVLEADTGERALELARNFDGTIDILVSDVVIPVVSGRELAMRLRAANKNLRVLLVSGIVDAQVLDGLPGASSSFLAKPFRPSELIREVHALLSRGDPEAVVS